MALFCLLKVSTLSAGTVWSSGTGSDLVVFLRTAPDQAAGPIDSMKKELGALMERAGYRIEWRDLNRVQRGTDAARVVVLELDGACGAATGGAGAGKAPLTSLGSSAVENGRVLPFSKVQCGALNGLLGAALAGEAGSRRDALYGRALARVVAHEFYHVLGQTLNHDHVGIGKATVIARELLDEDLAFGEAALAKLRRPGEPVERAVAVNEAGEAGGR